MWKEAVVIKIWGTPRRLTEGSKVYHYSPNRIAVFQTNIYIRDLQNKEQVNY